MSRRFDYKRMAFMRVKPILAAPRRFVGQFERIGKSVHAATSGRVSNVMTTYEQFVGISDVKAAQRKVTEIEQQFLDARQNVTEAASQVNVLQTELHTVRGKLDRTPRDDPKFLELATEEHRMLQNETRLKDWFASVEAKERDTFSKLSAAVRESHERQRSQQERTKYWSVIGSIVGTLIGILGSSVVNHRRMQELRTLVLELGPGGFGSEGARKELAAVLHQLRESLGQGDDGARSQNLESVLQDTLKQHDELLGQQLKAIEKLITERNSKLTDQMRGLRRVSDVGVTGDTGTLEELLSDTEQKLEWEMKMSTLSTVVFIYGAFALTLPILYSIFK